MEMVPSCSDFEFKQGDLVKWFYSSPELPYTIEEFPTGNLSDVGIVLSVELWDGDNEIRQVIEVYFAKAGINWCNPKSLEIVSKY